MFLALGDHKPAFLPHVSLSIPYLKIEVINGIDTMDLLLIDKSKLMDEIKQKEIVRKNGHAILL